jgi:hypothetical protein
VADQTEARDRQGACSRESISRCTGTELHISWRWHRLQRDLADSNPLIRSSAGSEMISRQVLSQSSRTSDSKRQ